MYFVRTSYYVVLKYEVRGCLFKSFVSLEPPVVAVLYSNHSVNVYWINSCLWIWGIKWLVEIHKTSGVGREDCEFDFGNLEFRYQ